MVAVSRLPFGIPSLSFFSGTAEFIALPLLWLSESLRRMAASCRDGTSGIPNTSRWPSVHFGSSFRHPSPRINRIWIEPFLTRDLPFAINQRPEKAASVTLVADAGTECFDLQEHGVLIAVDQDLLHDEFVAGALSLEPKLVPASAPERCEPGLDRLGPSLFVHECDHEHLEANRILHDRGHQPARFFKVYLHALRGVSWTRGK